MNCPKCGNQNPQDAQVCTSCGSELTQPPTPAQTTVDVKTSGLAIASFVFAILSPFAFFLATMLGSKTFVITCMFTAMLALILGIISLVQIGLSAGRVTGKGLASIGTAIPVVLFSIIFLNVLLHNLGCIVFRRICSSNLAQIGRAMHIYNSDYGDLPLPRAGGPGAIWQPRINNWQAKDRITAFNLKPDGTGGSATISSSLYLLVKYVEQDPRLFVCPKDTGTTEFKPADYGALEKDIEKFWDFGPNPSKHCSVSYHLSYGPYSLSIATGLPRTAVIADRNPWLDSPAAKTADFRAFDPNGDSTAQMAGNSIPHKSEGQNVLFMDLHVAFEKRPYCAVNKDNIYTYWNGSDIRQGAPPVIGSQPKGPLDSLLVNDPPLDNSK